MRGLGVALLILVHGQSVVAATRRSTTRVVQTTVIAQAADESRLAVVPFAVPVAVPIAVFSQPTVLYSYRQHASPPADHADVDAAVNTSEPLRSPPGSESAVASTATLLTARCAKCHSGAASPGHLQFFDAGGQILLRLPRRAILEMVAPNDAGRQRMPPGELPKLSAEDVSAVRQWAQPPLDLAY